MPPDSSLHRNASPALPGNLLHLSLLPPYGAKRDEYLRSIRDNLLPPSPSVPIWVAAGRDLLYSLLHYIICKVEHADLHLDLARNLILSATGAGGLFNANREQIVGKMVRCGYRGPFLDRIRANQSIEIAELTQTPIGTTVGFAVEIPPGAVFTLEPSLELLTETLLFQKLRAQEACTKLDSEAAIGALLIGHLATDPMAYFFDQLRQESQSLAYHGFATNCFHEMMVIEPRTRSKIFDTLHKVLQQHAPKRDRLPLPKRAPTTTFKPSIVDVLQPGATPDIDLRVPVLEARAIVGK